MSFFVIFVQKIHPFFVVLMVTKIFKLKNMIKKSLDFAMFLHSYSENNFNSGVKNSG